MARNYTHKRKETYNVYIRSEEHMATLWTKPWELTNYSIVSVEGCYKDMLMKVEELTMAGEKVLYVYTNLGARVYLQF
jgi:hypothetical protein